MRDGTVKQDLKHEDVCEDSVVNQSLLRLPTKFDINSSRETRPAEPRHLKKLAKTPKEDICRQDHRASPYIFSQVEMGVL
jgi:hypothetical protein